MSRLSKFVLWFTCGAAVFCLAAFLLHTHKHQALEPGFQSYGPAQSKEWVPYGGTWKTLDDAMQNDSEERGAKLMNGSADWKNYFVEADIQILGPYGDAGIMLRSSDEEEGVDAYHGYYAIIRNMNDTLTLGRADYGLNQFVIQPILPQVGELEWLHLKFYAVDCDLVAVATSSSGHVTTAAAHDRRCITQGRFGLRSFSTSARWKNIRVGPAAQKDIQELTRHTVIEDITYTPDWVRSVAPSTDVDRYMVPIRREAKRFRFNLDSQSIEELGLMNLSEPKRVTIHGVVTLTSPELYIQDTTGGIRATKSTFSGPVKVGDEVEAQGDAISFNLHPLLTNAAIRVLSSNVPVPAIAVTAFELAVGNHDGHFVEVEGELQSSHTIPDNRLVLELAEGSQRFNAIADLGELPFLKQTFEPGSTLRLRGVDTLDTSYTGNRVSFAILLPSAHSIDLLANPPWWNQTHIIMVALIFVTFLLALFVLSNRIQQWKIESVLDERERLALEMHDTLAQSFAGIGFQLHAIREETKEQSPAEKQIDLALEMVRSSHEEAKKSIAALRPRFLNNADLIDALRQAAERLVEGESVRIVAHTEGPVNDIPLRVSDALFRIGQEAISNAVRHSGASTIVLSLSLLANQVRLSVRDDGKGFNTLEANTGFGIRGMAKRADNITAKLQFHSTPNAGTTVVVTADLAPRRSIFERIHSATRFLLGE